MGGERKLFAHYLRFGPDEGPDVPLILDVERATARRSSAGRSNQELMASASCSSFVRMRGQAEEGAAQSLQTAEGALADEWWLLTRTGKR